MKRAPQEVYQESLCESGHAKLDRLAIGDSQARPSFVQTMQQTPVQPPPDDNDVPAWARQNRSQPAYVEPPSLSLNLPMTRLRANPSAARTDICDTHVDVSRVAGQRVSMISLHLLKRTLPSELMDIVAHVVKLKDCNAELYETGDGELLVDPIDSDGHDVFVPNHETNLAKIYLDDETYFYIEVQHNEGRVTAEQTISAIVGTLPEFFDLRTDHGHMWTGLSQGHIRVHFHVARGGAGTVSTTLGYIPEPDDGEDKDEEAHNARRRHQMEAAFTTPPFRWS